MQGLNARNRAHSIAYMRADKDKRENSMGSGV